MNDQAFLKAFEDGTLPPREFSHRGHIRMAWLYLHAYGYEAGVEHIRSGIQQFAARLGATTKYHETITIFWARLVQHMITDQPAIDDFETFLTRYPLILDSHLVERHYSRETLFSARARQEWVEPDLILMPAI